MQNAAAASANALCGEQRLHTATTTWRIGDHAASGTRTRHMHCCASSRHATRVLSCASGQITGSHEYTIVYQYRLDSTLLDRTRCRCRPIDRNDSRENVAGLLLSPRPSGDQEPSEAVTRTDTRPTHHQVAPQKRKLLISLHIHFSASLCAPFMTMPTDTTSLAQPLTEWGYSRKLKPPTWERPDLANF